MDWPDLEALVMELLQPALYSAGYPALEVGTDVPLEAVEAGQQFVRVFIIGGTDNGLTDRTRVGVETFAPTRPDAMDLGSAARRCMLALSGTSGVGGLIDRVRTSQRPQVLPYRNDKTTRVGASYDVETRLQ